MSKMVKYFLYIKVEDREYFLNDDEDRAPDWQSIHKLGDKLPWLFETPKAANFALMNLVNIPLTNVAEIRIWGES